MRITYNAPRFATFGSLKPGELFRHESNRGLFLKTDPDEGLVAVVIDPLDTETAIKAGRGTTWGTTDIVIPVRSIVVDFEELK